MKRILLPSALFSAALLLVAYQFDTTFSIAVSLVILVLAIVFAVSIKHYKSAFSVSICLILSFFVLMSYTNESIERNKQVNALTGKTVSLTALITEEPEIREDYNIYCAATEEIALSGAPQEINITFTSNNQNIKAFDTVELIAAFEEVPQKYKTYYFSDKIYLSAKVKEIISVKQSEGFHPYKYAILLRKAVRNSIVNNLSGETEGILSGFIIGGSGLLDTETESAFKNCGINHMIAVSGMHMSILSSAITALLSFLGVGNRTRIFIILPILILYCALSGFTPSSIRAVLMSASAFSSGFFKKRADGLNILGLVAIVMLIFNPNLILSVSFGLSFSAVLGILTLSPVIEKYTVEKIKISGVLGIAVKNIVKTAATSFCATVGIFPLSVFVLGGMSNIGIIANVLISFASTVSIIIGMIVILFDLFIGGFISTVLYRFLELILYFIRGIAKLLGDIPFSYTNLDSLSQIAASVLVLAAIMAFIIKGEKFSKFKLKYMGVTAALVFVISLAANIFSTN